MPNVSTYVRTDQLSKYLSISSQGKGAWSEFVSNALDNMDESAPTAPVFEEDSRTVIREAKVVNTNTVKPIVTMAKSNYKLCKNGHPVPDGRIKCLGKGCKYA